MAPDKYISLINECLSEKKIGDKFTLRELIGEERWGDIANPASFGKWFKSEIKKGNISGIMHVGTDPSKRRDIYEKI